VGGLVGRGDSTGTDRSGGRHVGLCDSTSSHWSGGHHVRLSDSIGGGTVPSGSGAPLATPSPEMAVARRDRHPRDPLTYPTHHTRAAQRAAAAARRREHRGPPRLTKRGRI
jgi:hypothetical protein